MKGNQSEFPCKSLVFIKKRLKEAQCDSSHTLKGCFKHVQNTMWNKINYAIDLDSRTHKKAIEIWTAVGVNMTKWQHIRRQYSGYNSQ